MRNSFRTERRYDSAGETIRHQLLWSLLLRIILYTLLPGISFLLRDDKYNVITVPSNLLVLFLLIVYLTTIGSAFMLMKPGRDYRRFTLLQCLTDPLFASILVYFSGGSHSIFTSVYFFPIIAGGLLAQVKGGLISAAASTLLYGLILILGQIQYMPDYLSYYLFYGNNSILVNINQFAVKGLTFFLVAFISAIFGKKLKSTTEALSDTQLDYDHLALLYKEIFDNISTGIITIDGDGYIGSVNNATTAITGFSREELTGKQLATFFPGVDLSSQQIRNACDFSRNDNQKIRLGYTHTSLNKAQRRENDQNPEKRDQDRITIITLKDISELERLEKQMRQAEKLAAIGTMSASIAHDFRNPLTAISGSAQILAQEYASASKPNPQNYELTRIIIRESDRLIKTISDFLKFARPESLNREHFQLAPCVSDIIQVCQADPHWPKTCKLTIDIDPEFSLWGDSKQVFTVISHLINNARAFCPKQEELIEICAENKIGPDREEMVCITVNDNGPGIASTDTKQIFEPFYTSRPDGTGLGLAIVRQIIEAHNGYIVIGTADIGGASISLFLPHKSNN